MSRQLPDEAAMLLKLALEFNAGIVTLATAYYGNLSDRKNFTRFQRELRLRVREYEKALSDLERLYVGGDDE